MAQKKFIARPDFGIDIQQMIPDYQDVNNMHSQALNIENANLGSWKPDTVTTSILAEWSEFAAWRYIYKYTSQGLETEIIEQELKRNFSDGSTSWVNNKRNTYTYTYDLNNNLITSSSQRFMNNTWVSITYHKYTYDADNNLIISFEQKYN